MIGSVLCILAFIATYFAARRDRVIGLGVLMTVGYVYGIVRANVPQTMSHFVFDAAVAGFYVAFFTQRVTSADRGRASALRPWMLLLVGWPCLLALLPVQDPLIQLVGLRGAVFLVPFLLVGARLDDSDLRRLAVWLAFLNLAAFGVAAAEYVLGIEMFFPRNAVTELIYRSRDVAGNTAHRIPSSFTGAHAYAATMTSTTALLLGVWLSDKAPMRTLLATAIVASIIGVFMAASRTHMLVLGLVVIAATGSGRVRLPIRILWIVGIGAITLIVMSDERLQRFRSLEDTDYVTDRIGGSINSSFVTLALDHPMGVGLGGGGTSLPYFLMNRIKERVLIENEYGRIMLEQGIPGLLIWLAFLVWTFTRPSSRLRTGLPVVRRLLWVLCGAYWASSVTGTGLLTSVPLTAAIMLYMGWIASTPPVALELARAPDRALERAQRERALVLPESA
jgi:hypothetical protein